MSKKNAVMGRMVARIKEDVDKPERDSFDDEVEEGGVDGLEDEEEGAGEVFVGEVVGVEDDIVEDPEVGETVIGIGIMGEGVSPAAVVIPSSVLLGSSGKPVFAAPDVGVIGVGVMAGEVEPPNVHPSPRGIDGP